MQQEQIRQVEDRIISALSYSVFYDNLEKTEYSEYHSREMNEYRENLFLYFSSFVSIDMLKLINDELGTRINLIFNDYNGKLKVIVDLKEVIIK